ncbi:MAG: hypothetical protein KIT66_07045 [Chitinophagaceae bacterium]|nr:hypothetical protein [Chitinophagaceae bacterium]
MQFSEVVSKCEHLPVSASNRGHAPEVSQYLYWQIFDNYRFNHFTFGNDSSILPCYGDVEGAKKGYNPEKRSRKSGEDLMPQENTQKRLSTLRYRTFATGAYFEKVKDLIVLKIALVKKRRKWFTSLWNQSQNFTYSFSNM